MGVAQRAAADTTVGTPSVPISARGTWIDVHDSLTDTAATPTVLARPFTYSSTYVRPLVCKGFTRFFARAYYSQGASAITVHPKVRFYGVYGEPTAPGVYPDDDTVQYIRLDDTSSWTAAGMTLTIDPTNDNRQTTYRYTNLGLSGVSVDAQGCWSILPLVETAAAGTNLTVCKLQILLLN